MLGLVALIPTLLFAGTQVKCQLDGIDYTGSKQIIFEKERLSFSLNEENCDGSKCLLGHTNLSKNGWSARVSFEQLDSRRFPGRRLNNSLTLNIVDGAGK